MHLIQIAVSTMPRTCGICLICDGIHKGHQIHTFFWKSSINYLHVALFCDENCIIETAQFGHFLMPRTSVVLDSDADISYSNSAKLILRKSVMRIVHWSADSSTSRSKLRRLPRTVCTVKLNTISCSNWKGLI